MNGARKLLSDKRHLSHRPGNQRVIPRAHCARIEPTLQKLFSDLYTGTTVDTALHSNMLMHTQIISNENIMKG